MSTLLERMKTRTRTEQRLQWLAHRAQHGALRRHVETMTLDELEDSRRPLLFSLLPRMLNRDGSTPRSLQRTFEYVDQDRDRAPALMISSQRWSRAIATSRKLASRRVARGRKP